MQIGDGFQLNKIATLIELVVLEVLVQSVFRFCEAKSWRSAKNDMWPKF